MVENITITCDQQISVLYLTFPFLKCFMFYKRLLYVIFRHLPSFRKKFSTMNFIFERFSRVGNKRSAIKGIRQ